MPSNKLMRVGKKLERLLIDVKSRNNLKSLADAGERMADYLNGIDKKKKMKEKIIREIQF